MIELHRVSKTVQSGENPLTIVHPLDLEIPTGQLLSIVGPSGSGKSTLLGLIAGLDMPTTGSIMVNGTDITSLNEDSLAEFRGRTVGFVFQFFHLMPSLTAFENILVPLEIIGKSNPQERARDLMSEVGLTGRSHYYPSQLSGGEQQRLSIAVALANEPGLLLVDEPTGELDSDSGQYIWQVLKHVGSDLGTTIVAVTHDESIYEVADRILYISDGRIDREHSRVYGKPEAWEEHRVIDRTSRISLPEYFLTAFKGKTRARVTGIDEDILISLKDINNR